jgi:hypothetical protein
LDREGRVDYFSSFGRSHRLFCNGTTKEMNEESKAV